MASLLFTFSNFSNHGLELFFMTGGVAQASLRSDKQIHRFFPSSTKVEIPSVNEYRSRTKETTVLAQANTRIGSKIKILQKIFHIE